MTLFSRWADWYDELYAAAGRDPAAEVRAIEAALRASASTGTELHQRLDQRRLRILDIGCGTARHAEAFAMLGDYTGIDPCKEMLEVARRNHPHATLLQSTATGVQSILPVGESFDVVVLLFAVAAYADSMEEAGEWLKAAAECLAPDGALFVGIEVIQETLRPAQPRTVVLQRGSATLTRESTALAHEGDRLECTFHFHREEHGSVESWSECHSHMLKSRREWHRAIATALRARREPASFRSRMGYLSVASGAWEEVAAAASLVSQNHCLPSPHPCALTPLVAPF